MTVQCSSLHRPLPWARIAGLLGLHADEALPARLDCPGCRHRRCHAYEDTALGGVWFACPGCGRCGDLIELAALAWGLSVPAAGQRLAQLGLCGPEQDLSAQRPSSAANAGLSCGAPPAGPATTPAGPEVLPTAVQQEASTITALDVAGWMLEELETYGLLPHRQAAQYIADHFGDSFVTQGQHGGLRIAAAVRTALKQLAGDRLGWDQRKRRWQLDG